jgi:hypothetical protein
MMKKCQRQGEFNDGYHQVVYPEQAANTVNAGLYICSFVAGYY